MIYTKSRTENILVQNLAGETIVYDLDNDKAFCLNESLSAVWRTCDGTKSFDEIREEVSVKLNHKVSDEFVQLSLSYLDKHALISKWEKAQHPVLSRRNLIRQAGLTTMAALPLITEIVAPTPVTAASLGCDPTWVPLGDLCRAGIDICCNYTNFTSFVCPLGAPLGDEFLCTL